MLWSHRKFCLFFCFFFAFFVRWSLMLILDVFCLPCACMSHIFLFTSIDVNFDRAIYKIKWHAVKMKFIVDFIFFCEFLSSKLNGIVHNKMANSAVENELTLMQSSNVCFHKVILIVLYAIAFNEFMFILCICWNICLLFTITTLTQFNYHTYQHNRGGFVQQQLTCLCLDKKFEYPQNHTVFSANNRNVIFRSHQQRNALLTLTIEILQNDYGHTNWIANKTIGFNA